MRVYDVVAEERNPGAIGEFGRRRFNGIVAESDEAALRQAFENVRISGKETRGAWVIISRGPLTPEETDEYLAHVRPQAKPPHWPNPWDDAVPVPIEELTWCVEHLFDYIAGIDGVVSCRLTPETLLIHWNQAGDKLDAYILPGPPEGHCIGIRYGSGPSEYLSPLANQERTEQLLRKYRPEP